MSLVFADTFYWAALTNINDPAHGRAMEMSRIHAPDRIVTTEEVLVEYLAFFAGAGERIRDRAGLVVAELIDESGGVRVAQQNHDSFLAGLELYRARPDKRYSLVDCISMQIMRREGISEALTNDKHFEQEGFRALFRDS